MKRAIESRDGAGLAGRGDDRKSPRMAGGEDAVEEGPNAQLTLLMCRPAARFASARWVCGDARLATVEMRLFWVPRLVGCNTAMQDDRVTWPEDWTTLAGAADG
jgi:hypothetical protein